MKKITVFLVILSIFLTTAFNAQAVNLNFSYLSDTDMHWAEDYITDLFDMGVMMGDGKNSNAEKNITRGEVIALITRFLFDVDSHSANKYFNDVKKDHIFYKNISIAKENGIIKGDTQNNFNPEKNITREEIVIILSRLLSDKKDLITQNINFNDITKNYAYYDELNLVFNLGIISGDEKGNFNPKMGAKRGEVAKMIYNTIQNYQHQKDKNDAVNTALSFVKENLSQNLVHTAKKEYDYANNVLSFAKNLGFEVEKNISNLTYDITDFSNNTAHILFSYDVGFNAFYSDSNQKLREYKGKMLVKLMHKNNKWQIFKYNEKINPDKKINLTWEVFNSVPSYAPEGLNVISPTWYEIISDNSYKNSKTLYSDKSTTLKITDKSNKDYINYANKNGYDLWIAYRNNFNANDTEKFLNSTSSRKKAIEFLVEGVINTKADGINIDFENMKDKYSFTNHAKEVAIAMRSLGLVTSVDINKYDKYGGNWSLCYDRDALSDICDYTVVMAYDQNGTWSEKAGPVAGFSWVEDVVKSVLSEVDNSTLILGVPFYVRHWKEQNGRVIKTSAISMQRAKEIINENGAKILYSEKDGQNVATWSDGTYNYTIYIEDASSVAKKCTLINKYNLPGVASWRFGFETSDVWSAINDTIY
ncbi:MAG: hypothetical protein E7404_01550 [Ruminococcaceae bacterium]|nr:hypothetical protein [Oscillospiraceae bacterium]